MSLQYLKLHKYSNYYFYGHYSIVEQIVMSVYYMWILDTKLATMQLMSLIEKMRSGKNDFRLKLHYNYKI